MNLSLELVFSNYGDQSYLTKGISLCYILKHNNIFEANIKNIMLYFKTHKKYNVIF